MEIALYMRPIVTGLFVTLFLICAGNLPVHFNSSIEGVGTDACGAVIPGADVRVTDLSTGIAGRVKTSTEVLYRVLNPNKNRCSRR